MATETVEPTRAQIADTIAELKVRHDRLPVHYVDARDEIMGEIESLVDDWLEASD